MTKLSTLLTLSTTLIYTNAVVDPHSGTYYYNYGYYYADPHHTGLIASHHTYPGYEPSVFGVHGQDCTPDSGDFPDKCPTPGDLLKSNVDGIIGCTHNFDCCTCGTMHCGPDCGSIDCNGDSSCYGVKDVIIEGGELGAALVCNGDLSCKWTEMRGHHVGGIMCTGDGACAYSKFNFECITEEPCTMLCVGDDSCRSHEDDPAKQARFVLQNSFGMKCAHDACRDATFIMLQNLGGDVLCVAEEACHGADISIDNIGIVYCGGIMACKDAHIFVKDPEDGFSILCAGRAACEGMSVEVIVTSPDIHSFRAISCMSPESCKGIKVAINKVSAGDLLVEELSCGAAMSCQNAVFDLGPNVIFDECRCAPTHTKACENVLGLDKCMPAGIDNIVCDKKGACKGAVEQSTNPSNNFKVICAMDSSCQDMALTVINDGARRGVTGYGGISCDGSDSCSGMTINYYNGARTRINAGTIACNAPKSCVGTQIHAYGMNVDVNCFDASSCEGCTVTWEGLCSRCDNPQIPC